MTPDFIPLPPRGDLSPAEMVRRATEFNVEIQKRRTTRAFRDRPVPREVIEQALLAAGSAPSGAHRQPWQFVVVSDPVLKHDIRVAAEEAEAEFYQNAPGDWLQALAPLGTDQHKPYLETAPYLIAVFSERYQLAADGSRSHNYYVTESVGIATGFLIAALHHAGLSTLTHTPSPMAFLNRILKRGDNERPFLLLVVGYPAEDAQVPNLVRKPPEQFTTWR